MAATPSHLSADEGYPSGNPMYLYAATAGAGRAINRWLQQIEHGTAYSFEVEGVECSLEFSIEPGVEVAPHAQVEDGRWRWGRLENGDPDEDETGEDILLDAALGRPFVRGRQGRRHRTSFPPFAEGTLTQAEIEACAAIRATANLEKLTVRKRPERHVHRTGGEPIIGDVSADRKRDAK